VTTQVQTVTQDRQGTAATLRLLWLTVLSLAFLAVQSVMAQARPESFADLADTVSPAVVNITTSTMVARGTGPTRSSSSSSPEKSWKPSSSARTRKPTSRY